MRTFALALFFVFCVHVAPACGGYSWPAADIAITLPASEGSESSAYFELLAAPFLAQTGKALSARHIPGQAGGDAWARMADDPPDGTVLTNVLLPNLILRTYRPDSGVYPGSMDICHIGAYASCVLWTSAASGIDSVKILVDTIRGAPGTVVVAGPGRFSAGRTASRMFDRMNGVRTTYIPYAGTVEAAKAALGGAAAVFWGYSAPPRIAGASFRALAVAADKRLASMPDVPTFRELGIELVEGVYMGIAVPSDVPELFREAINTVFSAIAREPGYIAAASAAGFIPLDMGRAEARTLYKQLEETAGNRVQDYGLPE